MRDVLRQPVIQSPMGGGPSRPELAAAVSNAGGLGFLAAGYKTADAVRAEIEATRRLTAEPFGVNVFVPSSPAVDGEALARSLDALSEAAGALRVSIGDASWHDDGWDTKLAMLLADPVPVVSFAFGAPTREQVAELQRVGTRVIVTVTAPSDIEIALTRGVDALCVQGIEAGAHRGGFTDDEAVDHYGLLALLGIARTKTDLPLIAAGAVMDGRDLAAVLAAGAVAAQMGTAFLRSDESGAHPLYKDALASPEFTTTALTRAFSGRRARGLVNRFMIEHPSAPLAYPQINDATRPLRAEAARRADPHGMSLWAGQGYRRAQARPAAEIVDRVIAEYRAI